MVKEGGAAVTEGRAKAAGAVGGAEISQAGERRIARIESLRALAALGVVTGHVWGRGHDYGPSAIDGFFAKAMFGAGFGAYLLLALSGYLLYWPFVKRDFGGGARMNLKQYALNRALRILPLYWVATTFLIIVQEGGGSAEQWLRFPLALPNFWQDTVATVDGPLWSVVVEMHFYLALPVLALVIGRVGRGSLSRGVLVLGAFCAVSMALWLWKVTPVTGNDQLWKHNFPAVFFFIGAGMMMAFVRLHIENARPAWLEHRILGSADLWMLASLPLWVTICAYFKLMPLVTIASALVIGACVLPLRPGPVMHSLDWRPIAVIGVASYSLYVWHSPIIENLAKWDAFPDGTVPLAAVVFPVSIGVALLSYRYIEAPFLGLRKRWSTSSAPVDEPSAHAEAADDRALLVEHPGASGAHAQDVATGP